MKKDWFYLPILGCSLVSAFTVGRMSSAAMARRTRFKSSRASTAPAGGLKGGRRTPYLFAWPPGRQRCSRPIARADATVDRPLQRRGGGLKGGCASNPLTVEFRGRPLGFVQADKASGGYATRHQRNHPPLNQRVQRALELEPAGRPDTTVPAFVLMGRGAAPSPPRSSEQRFYCLTFETPQA